MRTSLLCLTIAFTFAAMAQVPSYVPVSGLVAWYPMNNSAVDVGPNGLNGSASGLQTAVDRSGVTGGASAFNFSYATVPSNALLNTGAGLTVTAWVQLVDASVNQKIIGRTNASFNSGFILGVENGQLHPEVWNSAGVAHTFSAGNISSNTWTLVGITWATNGNLIAYVNGVSSVSTPAGALPIGNNSEPLIIGGSPWSTAPLYFPVYGNMDDIGIWNRALTPAEMLEVYNSVPTGVDHVNGNTGVALYPNPSGSTISITSAPELVGQSYRIIDTTGRKVAQGTLGTGLTTVGIENLSSGIYTVTLGDASTHVLRLVKQ